ncbi:MAG: transposase [Myxococcota bacterium]
MAPDALRFEQAGTQQTFEDYKAEVIHQDTRLARLDRQITEAIEAAPERLREVVRALQALRGVAQTTATVVVAEVGDFSRFVKPTQLMSWVGLCAPRTLKRWAGEGAEVRDHQEGNSHLRRVLTEAAWLYRHSPNSSAAIKKRRENVALFWSWPSRRRPSSGWRSIQAHAAWHGQTDEQGHHRHRP